MPYTMSTPFGNIPGQVTPYEQLQAQTAARMRSQAAADDAQSAQMHVLKQAIGGGDGPGSEPDFSFATGPKDTGAIDLARHNTMVDNREQGTAALRDQLDLMKPQDYLTATDRGDDARAKFKFDQDEMGIDTLQQQAFKNELQRQLGGQGAAPAAPMNPNFTPGGLNLNAMGGSGGGGGSAKPGSDADYLRLAILGSYRNKGGGGAADILKNRDEMAFKNREFDAGQGLRDLNMEKARLDMDQWKKEHADAAMADKDPTNYMATHPQLTANFESLIKSYVAKNVGFGRNASPHDIDTLLNERDRIAKALIATGHDKQSSYEAADGAMDNAMGPDLNEKSLSDLLALREHRNKAAGVSRFMPGGTGGGAPGAKLPYLPGL